MTDEWVLAVDLGTTRTRAAYRSPRSAEPILVRVPRTHLAWFPSVVARSPHGGWLVGEPARSRRIVRPDLCWSDVKRHLGEDIPHYLGGHPFTVVEAIAQVLAYAATLARRQAGRSFDRLALAAPVAFEDGRLATLRNAAELAGFARDTVSIVTEPEAAARAALGTEDGIWVVFDIGGGTFDAALVRSADGGLDVLDTVGDRDLSGHAIDATVADALVTAHGLDINSDGEAALRRAIYLDDAATAVKEGLSDERATSVFLPDPPLEVELTMPELRSLVKPIVDAAIEYVTGMLKVHHLSWDSVTGIVLSGGSTHSPAIRELLEARAPVRDAAGTPELAVILGLLAPVPSPATTTVPTGPYTTVTPHPKALTVANSGSVQSLRTLTTQTNDLNAVAFSPDGALLATAGDDHSVRLWDPATGTHHHTLTGHTDWLRAVAFSPDGTLLATAGDDHSVRLWDPATGTHHHTLTGHTGWVRAVAFSPDGAKIATASHDHDVHLWDPATDTPDRTLTGHTDWVLALAFSPDGVLLATAGRDRRVHLWDPATGTHHYTLTGHTGPVSSVAFSPDGALLATAGHDHSVHLWDPATGTHHRTLTGHTGPVGSIAFSPDGALLATAGHDHDVHLWDPATGTHHHTLTGHTNTINSITFCSDGVLLATASDDHTARIWGLP